MENCENKYNRVIKDVTGRTLDGQVDVYSVLTAFNVVCPARQHAIKKLLCTGIRGKGDAHQDLTEAIIALQRGLTTVTKGVKDTVKEKKIIAVRGNGKTPSLIKGERYPLNNEEADTYLDRNGKPRGLICGIRAGWVTPIYEGDE